MAFTVVRRKCAVCVKMAIQKSSSEFGTVLCIELECGHTITRDIMAPIDPEEIIAHEMGLGKTVCDLALLKRNKKKMLPALYIVKSGLRLQWMAETFRWLGLPAQVIYTSREKPYFDYFQIFIVSIDMVRALNWDEEICLRFQSVTVDECQLMKNSTSQRTKAIRKLFSKVPHRRGLSGTPIKNNAGEYFPILNFVNPEQFPSEAKFLREDVVWDGYKAHGLRFPKMFERKPKTGSFDSNVRKFSPTYLQSSGHSRRLRWKMD